jgi:hypothetical protein
VIVAGLLVGGYVSRRQLRRIDCLRELTPVITRRLAGAK